MTDQPIPIGAQEYIDAIKTQRDMMAEQWAMARAEVLTLRKILAAAGTQPKADVVPIKGDDAA